MLKGMFGTAAVIATTVMVVLKLAHVRPEWSWWLVLAPVLALVAWSVMTTILMALIVWWTRRPRF